MNNMVAAGSNSRGLALRTRTAVYDRENAEAARLILSNVPRFGGRDAGLVQWAYAWWCNHQRARKAAA